MAFSPIKLLKSLFRNISIEPALFVFSFVVCLYNAVMPNLIQQKICSLETQPPIDFICNDTALLVEATDIVTIRGTLKQTLPVIILLLAGFWRDSTGLDKPPINLSILCEIPGVSVQMFAYFYWTSSPWIPSITEGVINGLGGSSVLFYVGATWTIADNTAVEDRTTRFCYMGECILPIVINYIYGYIYTATFTILPGAFYLASTAIVTIMLIFYSISPCIYTPIETHDKKTNSVPEDLENCEQVSQCAS